MTDVSDEAAEEPRLLFGSMVRPGLVSAESGNVPIFIVNGLGLSVSQTEITMMLNFSNRAVAAVVMAPAMAKTVGEALTQVVAEYERETQQVVKSLAEVTRTQQRS